MQIKHVRPVDEELAALCPDPHAGSAPARPASPLEIEEDPGTVPGATSAGEDALAKVRSERDLYRRLLELGSVEEICPFLNEALAFLCEIADAHQGYLELRRPDEETDEPRWWAACGFADEELEVVRATLSRGIIAAATQSGEIVATNSALLDPRFRDNRSVRTGDIAAVLCAPIGRDLPVGVLYLQRRTDPRPFGPSDRDLIEVVSRHLGRHADHLLARQAAIESSDATRDVRVRLSADGMVGCSEALATVLREAAMVAPLDVSVLITGESGTGKSQVARLIHQNSRRARGPLVEINCASIPETLLESELFGALPGSHSTARRKMEGKVAAAEGGTLFLDEVGDLPLSVQAKLLQLLQSRLYYPLGSPRAVKADVRILAATNTDLEEAVSTRRFREDLFYRLQVVPLRMPHLRERIEDLPLLARHFVYAAATRHGLPRPALSRNALRALVAAPWPGNVRQLENAIEAATIRAANERAEQVEVAHLFPQRPHDCDAEPRTFQEATRRFQRDLLRRTLAETNGSVHETAQRLDLARSHVYTLVKAFGLRPGRGRSSPTSDGPA